MIRLTDLSEDQRELLGALRRAVLNSTRDFRDGPTYQHLAHEMRRIGIHTIDDLIQGLSPEFLIFDPPMDNAMNVLPTARGWYSADRHAPEIHAGLIPAVRGCFDRFCQFTPPSPTQARPVVISPHELWLAGGMPSKSELFVIGKLLEVEQVGDVTWTGDPASPWKVGLDASIMRFAKVGDFESFLEAVAPPSLAIAS